MIVRFIAVALVVVALVLVVVRGCKDTDRPEPEGKVGPDVRELIEQRGELLVMVRLDVEPIQPSVPGAPPTFAPERIAEVAAQVVDGVQRDPQGARVYRRTPFLGLVIDANELARLEADPNVVWIRYYAPLSARGGCSSTPSSALESATDLIEADVCWSAGLDGEGVTVVVIDYGIDETVPMLSGRVVAGGWFVDGFEDATEPGWKFGADPALGRPSDAYPGWNSHGTKVAGVLAGAGAYVFGVAPAANLISMRVTNDDGIAEYCDLHFALDTVIDILDEYPSIRVVNISLARDDSVSATAGEDPDEAFRMAVTDLAWKGVVVVTGAGNDADTTGISFPANVPETFAAAGSDDDDDLMTLSNWGELADVLAPGKDLALETDVGMFDLDGTSFSAAVLSGSLALMMTTTAEGSGPSAKRCATALAATGPEVTPPGSSTTRRRIDLLEAATAVRGPDPATWATTYVDVEDPEAPEDPAAPEDPEDTEDPGDSEDPEKPEKPDEEDL